MLRSLLSKNRNVRQKAIANLHEHIWHQGTVFPASAAAVPFLYELLTHPDVHDKGGIVALLTCIATGEGILAYEMRTNGEETCRRIRASAEISGIGIGAGGPPGWVRFTAPWRRDCNTCSPT